MSPAIKLPKLSELGPAANTSELTDELVTLFAVGLLANVDSRRREAGRVVFVIGFYYLFF